MHTTTRLLLPFTGEIDTRAITYALQLAHQRHATLVALALIAKEARLEHIQQAQDFLELLRHKAEQQHVLVEQTRFYTDDIASSVETLAREMGCEAVILFVSTGNEALLRHEEVRALMDSTTCNRHIVLLPDTQQRHHPLYASPLRRLSDEMERSPALIPVKKLIQERVVPVSFFRPA